MWFRIFKIAGGCSNLVHGMADADKWTYRNDDFAKDSGLLSYEESNSGKRAEPQPIRCPAGRLCTCGTRHDGAEQATTTTAPHASGRGFRVFTCTVNSSPVLCYCGESLSFVSSTPIYQRLPCVKYSSAYDNTHEKHSSKILEHTFEHQLY